MPATVSVGRLRFDLDTLVLYDGGEIVPLAPLPAQMLAELVRARGNVVSTVTMRESLWGDTPVEDRNLNQQMYVLRRVLRCDPTIAIENVPRRGYRLVIANAAAERRRRAATALVSACTILVVLASLLHAQQRQPADASFDRDLAVANYFATGEGAGHLDRAARYYRDLISLDPNSGAGYGGLAVVDAKRALSLTGRLRSRSFDAARSEATAALERDSRESNALTAFGIIDSVDDSCTDIARQTFDAAVAADPTGESPRAWRAMFRLSIGDFDGAGRDFTTLSQNAPTSGAALGLFGEWLVLNRDYVLASAVLSQAVELGNHPALTRYWLARAYHQRGLDVQALRLVNEVLAMYPNEPSALALRLRIEASLGRTRAALADFDRIARIRSESQIDPLALASADVAMGKRAEALRVLHRYGSSGLLGFYDKGRLRTDPDLDPLRSSPAFNTAVAI